MKRILTLLCLISLLLAPLAPQAGTTYQTLAKGASGPEVGQMQARLIAAGFLAGQVDGKYGEGTKKAVTALQNALREKGHKLAADGVAGPATLSLLYDDAVMQPFIDFSLGARGQRVVDVQARLIDLKFLDGQADGSFGQQTLEALKAFQAQLAKHQAKGIQISGLADAATREWLRPEADLSAFEIQAPEFFDDKKPEMLSDAYLNAKACILVNARDGTVLYAKNMQERLYPASTTKMMTLLLAVERGRLDEVVTLPAATGDVPKDSSLVPVYPGEKMSMRDLLYGLMIRSGNDAANAIAVICAGSIEKFVAQMNQRAAQLGMQDSHFQNPHGYHHKDHYSTARDLAILAINGMRNPEFAAIATALQHDLPATSKRALLQINNTNELLVPGSPYFFEGAHGIKSGYTSAAGFCYAGLAQQGEDSLLAVIMNSRTRNRGWDDMARLFRYGFVRLETKTQP